MTKDEIEGLRNQLAAFNETSSVHSRDAYAMKLVKHIPSLLDIARAFDAIASGKVVIEATHYAHNDELRSEWSVSMTHHRKPLKCKVDLLSAVLSALDGATP